MDIQELEHRLLSFGGSRVVTTNGTNHPETIAILLKVGQLIRSPRILRKPGAQSRCHQNALDLVLQKPWTRSYCTGYALTLDDGVWRPHSWVQIKRSKTIWETTVNRILYYGVADGQAIRIFTVEWESNMNRRINA